jgi:hypothetical protein
MRARQKMLLTWTKARRWDDANTGHRITRVHDRGRVRHVAWGPPSQPDPSACARICYALGQRIPTNRVLLGVYDRAEDARARCEREVRSAQCEVR